MNSVEIFESELKDHQYYATYAKTVGIHEDVASEYEFGRSCGFVEAYEMIIQVYDLVKKV